MTIPMAAPPGGESDAEPSDTFGLRSAKLGALLGVPRSAHAVLVGDWGEWAGDMRRHFSRVTSAGDVRALDAWLASDDPGELVLVACVAGRGLGLRELRPRMPALRRAVVRGGTLLFAAENRLGLRVLARDPSALWDRSLATPPGYRRLMGQAGFGVVTPFLPLPDLQHVDEFVSERHGDVALPSHASVPEKLARQLGLFPRIHSATVVMASDGEGGPRSLLDAVQAVLPAAARSGAPLLLERFDLRQRGALVLLLRDGAGGERFVCRVTTDAATDVLVRRNAEWAARVRAASPGVASQVPEPVATLRVSAGAAYVERLVPGIIAWKLAGRRAVEERMFAATYRFARTLALETRSSVSAGEDLSGASRSSQLPEWLDATDAEMFRSLRERLRERVAGTRLPLVLSHGDFGYGNVIADERSGAVHGVIDWDQAREDLAGVDLLNFLVQRASGMQAIGAAEAFRHLGERLVDGGFAGIDARLDFDELFPRGRVERATLAAWTALRFVERNLAYPALFAGSRSQSLEILRWALGVVS